MNQRIQIRENCLQTGRAQAFRRYLSTYNTLPVYQMPGGNNLSKEQLAKFSPSIVFHLSPPEIINIKDQSHVG